MRWGAEERGFLTIGRLGEPEEVKLSQVAVAGDDDWLFHHIDAVALHQILERLKISSALEHLNAYIPEEGEEEMRLL